jgi:hypothetical protein
MMTFLQRTMTTFVSLWLLLSTFACAQQMKINYYNDNYCGNYKGELQYCKF